MGSGIIIPLDHSSGYIWLCRILLNKVTKKDERDGTLALIISLLIELLSLGFFDFRSAIPLTVSSFVKGQSKIAFLIFLLVSLYRKGSWSSFRSFSEYNNFEKCSAHCCGEITLSILDLIAPLSGFKWDQKSFAFSVTSDSFSNIVYLPISFTYFSHMFIALLDFMWLLHYIKGFFGSFWRSLAILVNCFLRRVQFTPYQGVFGLLFTWPLFLI